MSEIVRTDNGGYIDVSTIKAMQSYKNWGISALSHYKTKENMCYFWVDENGDVNNLSRQQKGAKAPKRRPKRLQTGCSISSLGRGGTTTEAMKYPYKPDIDISTIVVEKNEWDWVRYGLKALATHPRDGIRKMWWIDSNLEFACYESGPAGLAGGTKRKTLRL